MPWNHKAMFPANVISTGNREYKYSPQDKEMNTGKCI